MVRSSGVPIFSLILFLTENSIHCNLFISWFIIGFRYRLTVLGLTTLQPLWVILCHTEKGRREIEKTEEEMKGGTRNKEENE